MEKKSKIKPILIFSVFMIVMVGLPAGSWYYLRSGLDFRKNLEIETRVKDKFANTELYTKLVKDNPNFRDHMNSGTMVLAKFDKGVTDALDGIADQFQKVKKFNIMLIKDKHNVGMPEMYKTYYIDGNLEEVPDLTLINNKGELINNYPMTDEGVKQLVSHIAVVLPRKIEKDIIVRQNEEN